MASNDSTQDEDRGRQIIAEGRRSQAEREGTYREQALKLFPWVCAHCRREFSGKKLRELTVHHKDHNHDNNPPDGSNWELLCLYCHDYEHSGLTSQWQDDSAGSEPGNTNKPTTTHRPFAALANLKLPSGDGDDPAEK